MVSPISISGHAGGDNDTRQTVVEQRRHGATAASQVPTKMDNDTGTLQRSSIDFSRSGGMIGSPPSSSILSLLSGNGSFKNAALAGVSGSSNDNARPGLSPVLSSSHSTTSSIAADTAATARPVRITGFNAAGQGTQNHAHSPSASSSSSSSDFATEAVTPPPFAADLDSNMRCAGSKNASAVASQVMPHHDDHDEMHDIFDDFSTSHGVIYGQLSPLSRSLSASASTTAGSDNRKGSRSAGRADRIENDSNEAGQRSGILGWLNGSNATNRGGANHKMSQSVGSSHGFPSQHGPTSDNNPVGLFRRLSISSQRKPAMPSPGNQSVPLPMTSASDDRLGRSPERTTFNQPRRLSPMAERMVRSHYDM